MTIESLLGAGNLSYRLSLLRDALCVPYSLLDDDPAGHTSFTKAQHDGLTSIADVTFTATPGQGASEFEDLLDLPVYEDVVRLRFGVDLNAAQFRRARRWSTRARDAFRAQGKPWNDQVAAELKLVVAHAVEAAPELALNAHKRGAFDALVDALEQRVNALTPTVNAVRRTAHVA